MPLFHKFKRTGMAAIQSPVNSHCVIIRVNILAIKYIYIFSYIDVQYIYCQLNVSKVSFHIGHLVSRLKFLHDILIFSRLFPPYALLLTVYATFGFSL